MFTRQKYAFYTRGWNVFVKFNQSTFPREDPHKKAIHTYYFLHMIKNKSHFGERLNADMGKKGNAPKSQFHSIHEWRPCLFDAASHHHNREDKINLSPNSGATRLQGIISHEFMGKLLGDTIKSAWVKEWGDRKITTERCHLILRFPQGQIL